SSHAAKVRFRRTLNAEFLHVDGRSHKKVRALQYRTYYHCMTPKCSAQLIHSELRRKPRLTKCNKHAAHCLPSQ
ncbi:hypothetical protein KR093_006116, partial [Drosophila rubida]